MHQSTDKGWTLEASVPCHLTVMNPIDKAIEYMDPKEKSRRLKQLPIHVLVSHVLSNHPLGTPEHELGTAFLGKWRDTHDEAKKAHETYLELEKDRLTYLRRINDLQNDLGYLVNRNARLYSVIDSMSAICRSLLPMPKLLEYNVQRETR